MKFTHKILGHQEHYGDVDQVNTEEYDDKYDDSESKEDYSNNRQG